MVNPNTPSMANRDEVGPVRIDYLRELAKSRILKIFRLELDEQLGISVILLDPPLPTSGTKVAVYGELQAVRIESQFFGFVP